MLIWNCDPLLALVLLNAWLSPVGPHPLEPLSAHRSPGGEAGEKVYIYLWEIFESVVGIHCIIFSVYIPNKHLSKQCARHLSAQKDTKMKATWPLPWGPAQGVGWIQTGKWIAGKPGKECCDGGKQSVCSMGQRRVHLMWRRLTPEACPSGLAEVHLHYEAFTSQIRLFFPIPLSPQYHPP